MEISRKIVRYSFASLLLLLPLAAYPLAWARLVRDIWPYWDNLTVVDPGILGLVAVAAVIAAPERLWGSLVRKRLLRWCGIAAAGCVAAAMMQQSLYGGPFRLLFDSLFYLTLPLAGIALAPELKRLLPFYCTGLFFLLLTATIRSKFCIGFVGNWNWNFSLLAVTLPAVFLVFSRSRRRLLYGGIAVLLGVIGIFFAFPEIAPRGTTAGAVGATAVLGTLLMLPRHHRWIYAILIVSGTFALFISTLNAPETANIRDSRIQLWRGSLDFTLAHAALGVGPSRFESRIPPYLPPRYFLTDYPATRHPHPHNELLHLWSGFGLAGLAMLTLFFIAAVRKLRLHDTVGLWLGWSFLLLLIHGQFDVLLGTPLTGTLFLLIVGVLAGAGQTPIRVPGIGFRYLLSGLLLAATLIPAVNNFRSGSALRHGRELLAAGKRMEALEEFRRSAAIRSTPTVLYLAGAVELFDRKDPTAALRWLNRLESEWGFPSFLHSNNRIARAYAVRGELPLALKYFNRERQNFPFSAINAGMRLSILRQLKLPLPVIAEAEREFETNMEMRHLKPDEFGKLMSNQGLDDEPFVRRK